MRNTVVILTFLAAGTGIAWAQNSTWAAYEPAFPAFPCQDGWMGCIQEGRRIDPEVQRDGQGMPVPADLRVGWFDLEPTANFSPFVSLSKYPGTAPRLVGQAGTAPAPTGDGTTAPVPTGDGVAVADPEPKEIEFFDPAAEKARQEAENTRLAEAEAQRLKKEADEEAARAALEAKQRDAQAADRQKAADRAKADAANAKSEADRIRLEAEAERQREQAAKAKKEAEAARAMEAQRLAEAKKKEQEAAAAAAASKRAEDEKKAKEAEEARLKAQRDKEEAAARAKAEAEAKAAADKARLAEEARAKAALAEAEKAAQAAQLAMTQAKSEDEKKRLAAEQAAANEARAKAEAEAKAKAEKAAADAAAAALAKAEQEQAARAAAEQKRLEEEKKRLEEEERKRREAAAAASGGSAAGATAADAVVAGAEGCSDLVQLETVAILGKLDATQVQCLETSLAGAERMTQKAKISRMLMVNAFSAGETDRWEDLMKRHLEEIEQADPDLCYKYALHLSKKTSIGSAYGVIRWTNVALENRTVWTGNTYTQRVFSLYKIRAAAAQRIWQELENTHAVTPSEESNQKVKDARNQTKVFAREWYEYAKVSGKDPTTALNLCMSAAGTKDYCEAG